MHKAKICIDNYMHKAKSINVDVAHQGHGGFRMHSPMRVYGMIMNLKHKCKQGRLFRCSTVFVFWSFKSPPQLHIL